MKWITLCLQIEISRWICNELEQLRYQNPSLFKHFWNLKYFDNRTKGYCVPFRQTGCVFSGDTRYIYMKKILSYETGAYHYRNCSEFAPSVKRSVITTLYTTGLRKTKKVKSDVKIKNLVSLGISSEIRNWMQDKW